MHKNVIDQMRGRLDHPTGAARGAKAPAFAGERDQVLMLTPIALDAQEAVLQQAALQGVIELLFDERGEQATLGVESFDKPGVVGRDYACCRDRPRIGVGRTPTD